MNLIKLQLILIYFYFKNELFFYFNKLIFNLKLTLKLIY